MASPAVGVTPELDVSLAQLGESDVVMVVPKTETLVSITKRYARRSRPGQAVLGASLYRAVDRDYFTHRGVCVYLFARFLDGTVDYDAPLLTRCKRFNDREEARNNHRLI